jgi:hypothetical protein
LLDNELAMILHQQLLMFKSANDRWISKKNVGEEAFNLLIICNDRILSALTLFKHMVNESEMDYSPKMESIHITLATSNSEPHSNNDDVNVNVNCSVSPSSGELRANAQPATSPSTCSQPKPVLTITNPSFNPSKGESQSKLQTQHMYSLPPTSPLPATPSSPNDKKQSKHQDEPRPLLLKNSREKSLGDPLQVVLPTKGKLSVKGDEDVVKKISAALEKAELAIEYERKSSEELRSAKSKASEVSAETEKTFRNEPGSIAGVPKEAKLKPIETAENAEVFKAEDTVEIISPLIEPVPTAEAFKAEERPEKIIEPITVSTTPAADTTEISEKAGLSIDPISAPYHKFAPVQELTPQESPVESNFAKAKLQNNKRYFFNHPPKSWADLHDIKAAMKEALEQLTEAADNMETNSGDRNVNVQMYVSRGQQIHDLAQFAVDQWESSAMQCRNPMVKKDLLYSFKHIKSMRGVLAMLLKRKISVVKNGDEGHLLSSCTQLKTVFDSVIQNLIAGELTKEQ